MGTPSTIYNVMSVWHVYSTLCSNLAIIRALRWRFIILFLFNSTGALQPLPALLALQFRYRVSCGRLWYWT